MTDFLVTIREHATPAGGRNKTYRVNGAPSARAAARKAQAVAIREGYMPVAATVRPVRPSRRPHVASNPARTPERARTLAKLRQGFEIARDRSSAGYRPGYIYGAKTPVERGMNRIAMQVAREAEPKRRFAGNPRMLLRRGNWYVYHPTGWDITDPKITEGRPIADGEFVSIVQGPAGTGSSGMWGQRGSKLMFVAIADNHGNRMSVFPGSLHPLPSQRPHPLKASNDPDRPSASQIAAVRADLDAEENPFQSTASQRVVIPHLKALVPEIVADKVSESYGKPENAAELSNQLVRKFMHAARTNKRWAATITDSNAGRDRLYAFMHHEAKRMTDPVYNEGPVTAFKNPAEEFGHGATLDTLSSTNEQANPPARTWWEREVEGLE